VVASDKLDRLMAAPRLPIRRKSSPDNSAPAVSVSGAALHGLKPVSFTLQRGEIRRLDGPEGCGKSTLLLMLAGFESRPKSARFAVLGDAPSAIRPGQVLYLGRHAPQLKGSLHRDATIGLGRSPDAGEFTEAMKKAGLGALSERLGGNVAEGRRNLTAGEQARLHLVRGLLSRPDLALIDADEIRLEGAMLAQLLDHLACVEAAVLLVTSDPEAVRRLGPAIRLRHASGAQNIPCPVTFVTKEMS
jgi:ABC-type transport system involved in cytochrome bd biosynthesis fused ATPase/permease subunit